MTASGRRAVLALGAALIAGPAAAQNIAVDGRLTPAQTLVGPNYTIGANLGKQVGPNLFQSFGRFGLSIGESATFTGPASVANIIGRVTGGSPSAIDGLVRSAIAGANLFLVNPFGIVFGPHAGLNVSGSFHAATADYLKFSDGAVFQATHPDGSSFSAAPPAAFGFLGAGPAAIAVNGGTLKAPGLSLVGGPVTITGGALSAPGGTIRIASAAGAGEFPVDPTQAATVTGFGPVGISGGARIAATSGSVLIRAGGITIDASRIGADDTGVGPAGLVQLQADTGITLSGGSDVHAIARASGPGGDLLLQTGPNGAVTVAASTVAVGSSAGGNGGRLTVATGGLGVTAGGAIASTARRSGAGGSIAVSAGAIVLDGGTALDQNTGISANTSGSGSGGAISVTAGQLTVRNGAGVLAQVSGSGAGGDVRVTVGGALTIAAGGSVGTATFAAGAAGTVTVGVGGAIAIDMAVDAGPSVLDGIGSFTTAKGNAGGVTVTAGSLSLADYGVVQSVTAGKGNSGAVAVSVAGTISIVAPAAGPHLPTGIIADALPGSGGDAGNVTVGAGDLALVNNAVISSDAAGHGNGGDVAVTAQRSLGIDGTFSDPGFFTGIISNAEPDSTGSAGNISVRAGTISLVNGGEISSSSYGPGNGGNVAVAAAALVIDGSRQAATTGITADVEPGATGHGGMVSVAAGSLAILANGQISTDTLGAGNAGNVLVSVAGTLLVDGSGGIPGTATGIFAVAGEDTATTRTGNAGTVVVGAGALRLLDNGEISSITLGSGSGGDIRISAGDITLSGAGPQVTAQSDGSGNAGAIALGAGRLRVLDGAGISTAAATANGGDISLGVADLLYLRQGAITTSVSGAFGNGGNIVIEAQRLVLDGSRIIARAVGGNGGNIGIVAGAFVPSSGSLVSASSQLGISGTVAISGTETGLNSSLVVLPGTLRSPEAILRTGCAARGARPRSSLLEAGRGGLPPSPSAALPALYLAPHPAVPPTAGAAAETVLRTGFGAAAGCGEGTL